jgi:hypothetical protein
MLPKILIFFLNIFFHILDIFFYKQFWEIINLKRLEKLLVNKNIISLVASTETTSASDRLSACEIFSAKVMTSKGVVVVVAGEEVTI